MGGSPDAGAFIFVASSQSPSFSHAIPPGTTARYTGMPNAARERQQGVTAHRPGDFSELPRVFARLRELGKPFVVIMPCSTLTTRYFRDLFQDIQVIATTIFRWYRGTDRTTARCNRPDFLEFSYKIPKILIARDNDSRISLFFSQPKFRVYPKAFKPLNPLRTSF